MRKHLCTAVRRSVLESAKMDWKGMASREVEQNSANGECAAMLSSGPEK